MEFLDVKLRVKVYIKEHENDKSSKELEIRDFLSNYDFLRKSQIRTIEGLTLPKNDTKKSVYDFFKDNYAIDYKYMNKLTQPVCYWSLSDNKDYIFNLYEGFAGVSKGLDGNEEVLFHLYKDSYDPEVKPYNKNLNNLYWANYAELNAQELQLILKKSYIQEYEQMFSSCGKWMKNTKYNPSEDTQSNLKGVILVKPTFDEKQISVSSILRNANTFETEGDIQGNELHIKESIVPGYIIICSRDVDKLTFAGVKGFLKEHMVSNANSSLNLNKNKCASLYEYMVSRIPPIHVYFKNGVGFNFVQGPCRGTKEIEYLKNDEYDNYVIRYDGYLKPTFIEKDREEYWNYFYYKDVVSHDELGESVYAKYSTSGLSPKFPSINYYSLKSKSIYKEEYTNEEGQPEKIDTCNYDVWPFKYLNEKDISGDKLSGNFDEDMDATTNASGNLYEYKWFNNGKHRVLPPVIEDVFDSIYNDSYEVLVEYFCQKLPKRVIDKSTQIKFEITSTDAFGEKKTQTIEVPLAISNIIELYSVHVNMLKTYTVVNADTGESTTMNRYEIKLQLK